MERLKADTGARLIRCGAQMEQGTAQRTVGCHVTDGDEFPYEAVTRLLDMSYPSQYYHE